MTWWVWALIVWALTASAVVAWLTVALAVRVETLEALREQDARFLACFRDHHQSGCSHAPRPAISLTEQDLTGGRAASAERREA